MVVTNGDKNSNYAEQLKKLQGEEWDSDSSNEETTPNNKVEVKEDGFVKLPKKTKVDSVKRSQEKANVSSSSSVVYLGRIPHGFYEKQMQSFFKQFGKVKRLRLSRNKKTGNSKHFAFLEFEEPEVATIVADTMNGYRLFDHVLVCHVLDKEKVHDRMFVGANKVFRPTPSALLERRRRVAPKTKEQHEKSVQRLLRNEQKRRKQLEDLGIDFVFRGYSGCTKEPARHTKFA